jgi:hypothetical protein
VTVIVTNNRCIVCKKPMHTPYDPAEFHADPPPTCSPECKATRKRRIEQDQLVRERKAWCPRCRRVLGPVFYSNPLTCANTVDHIEGGGLRVMLTCHGQLGTMNEPYAYVLWEDPNPKSEGAKP